MNQVNDTLGRVSFPALVQMQDNPVALREAMRRMIQCSTFLVFPLMVGIAACAKSELRLLYGEQWVPAAPYMQLACFTFALWPFHTINLRGITAMGRSDIFLKLEIVKKVLYMAIILAFFRYGVFVFMAVTAFVLGPLGVMINAWPNRKLLNYTLRMQMMDVLPTAAICAAEAAMVFGVDFLFSVCSSSLSPAMLAFRLFVQFISGASVFVLLVLVFKPSPAREYAQILVRVFGGSFPRLSVFVSRHFALAFKS